MINKGLNIWPHVHITDVASHFHLILTSALKASIPHGPKGYYLCTAGEYRLLEATQAIGQRMVLGGWTRVAESLSFSDEELDKYYSELEKIGGTRQYSGTNSRAISAQAEGLGWKPRYTDVGEFYRYCGEETERIGEEGPPFW